MSKKQEWLFNFGIFLVMLFIVRYFATFEQTVFFGMAFLLADITYENGKE